MCSERGHGVIRGARSWGSAVVGGARRQPLGRMAPAGSDRAARSMDERRRGRKERSGHRAVVSSHATASTGVFGRVSMFR